MAKSRALTVYLLKAISSEPDAFIKSDLRIQPHPVALASSPSAFLYAKPTKPEPPRWADFFEPHVAAEALGLVSSASAALLLEARNRWWAITFGQGRHLLAEGVYEDGFGLRVALNAIGRENIRSLDKETFDMIAGHAKQQATADVDAAEFGLDIERDLLGAVTGSPRDPEFVGSRISGRDPLWTALTLELEDLPSYLERLYDLFMDDSYKIDFPWIDNVHAVDDRDEIQLVDWELIRLLQAGDLRNIWLAPPEVLDWPKVRNFSYSLSARQPERRDIDWDMFIEYVAKGDPSRLSIDFLKDHTVYCIGEDAVVTYKWPVYRCIYAQITYSGAQYFLTNGRWYRIAGSFVDEVTRFYDGIAKLEEYLPTFGRETEGEYNLRVAGSSEQFALMHGKMIQYGGGKSSIELCDLITTDCDLVHIKRYWGSQSLSHLFAQGLNSAELFQVDGEFRAAADKFLPHSLRGRFLEERPAREELRVVFAIISEVDEPLALPFFAKLSLRHVARRLVGFGYRVAVARIRVASEAVQLKAFRKRSRQGSKRNRKS
jgi:uncharacterized protein (TIGR04141 family)